MYLRICTCIKSIPHIIYSLSTHPELILKSVIDKMATIEKFVTNRGNPGIIVDGFKFKKDKFFKNSKLWRCVEKSCKSNCKTDLDELLILGGRLEHDHDEPERRTIERQKVRHACKRKAEDEPSERPSKLIIKEIEKVGTDELVSQDITSVRQAMYRQRRKTQPKLPTSRMETIEMLKEYELKSSKGEDMIYVSSSESEIVMLTTKSNLQSLCQEDVQIFGDGTFQYCAKHFYQLYTLHIFQNGQYIPCVFFLLPFKTKACYIEMFRCLVDACVKENFTLNIENLNLDFELAVHDAARHFWPDVAIKGCQFHLAQAWYRKIQSLGLTSEYKSQDSAVGQWLKTFFGISFLDPAVVEECFVFDIFSEAPDSEKAVDFADYVVNNYIDQSSSFPPIIWEDSDVEGKRTTNGCESFHKEFSTMFYSSHPNIFDFLAKIQCVQTKTYLKIRAANGRFPSGRKESDNTKQKKELKARFENGELTRIEYVRRMAFKALPVV